MKKPAKIVRQALKPLVKRIDAWVEKDDPKTADEDSEVPMATRRDPEMPLTDPNTPLKHWSKTPIAKLPYYGPQLSTHAVFRAPAVEPTAKKDSPGPEL